MPIVINGVSAYETKLRGNVQYYIRASVVNSADVALFDTAETNATTLAGSQTVSLGDTAVGTDATGLANDTTVYNATVRVNGTDIAVAVTGSAAQTIDALITEINTDLGAAATAALSGGNIVITSATAGNESYVEITDGGLFSSLTAYVGILESELGGMVAALKATTLANGKDAWYVYKSAEEVYDPNSDRVALSSDYVPADLSPTFSDVEVEGELAAIAAKVNALRNKV